MEAERILALGGHEFDRRAGNDAVSDLIASLAGGRGSSICLLPTAGGDAVDQITRFRAAFAERGLVPSDVSLFRRGTEQVDLREHLLSQDAIYVGGGSLVNLLAIWRAHGVDEIVAEALAGGALLCGQSAGAMIWFRQGVTTSRGAPSLAPGLGVLPWTACVHYHAEAGRRRTYLAEVAAGLEGGFGLDDQAGILFEGGVPARAYSARPGADVWRVAPDGPEPLEAFEGRVSEEAMPAERLHDARPPVDAVSPEVLELRRTLAARRSAPGRLGRRGARR